MKINSLNRFPSMTPTNDVPLILERYNYNADCTLGTLYYKDRRICETLEPSKPIPCGKYILNVHSRSPRFSKRFKEFIFIKLNIIMF